MNSEARREFVHLGGKSLKAFRDAGHSLGEDDSAFGESGYTSMQHTLSHVEVKPSLALQPIDESVECEALMTPSSSGAGKQPTEVITPTSQNIAKIMALHLTTPTTKPPKHEPAPQAVMETSPLKHAAELFEPKTPPELMLSAQDISRTANSTPRKVKMLTRKRAIRDDTDTDTENNGKRACIEKDLGICRMPFSPIQNRRIMKERSVSDNNLLIRCSTPKEAMLRRRFFAETRTPAVDVPKSPPMKTPTKQANKNLRRFQSFSPAKLKTLQRHKAVDQFHPYKKFHDAPGTSKQSPIQPGLINIPEEVDDAAAEEPEEVRRATQEHNSIVIQEASGFDSFDFSHVVGKSISPIKPNLQQLLRSKILSAHEPDTTLELSADFSSSFQDAEVDKNGRRSVTPPPLPTLSTALPSPSPSKRHFHLRDLPKTPPRDVRLWRGRTRATPAKRSLPQFRVEFYDGRKHLDILCRLQSTPRLIEQIFKHVDDEDVLSAYAVSSHWKQIIDENKTLSKRRLDYIKLNKKPNKENITLHSPTLKPQYLRQPFAVHNYDTRSAARANATLNCSPPVSPNKSRFREYQKVVCFSIFAQQSLRP